MPYGWRDVRDALIGILFWTLAWLLAAAYVGIIDLSRWWVQLTAPVSAL